jgi:hypothetical protein
MTALPPWKQSKAVPIPETILWIQPSIGVLTSKGSCISLRCEQRVKASRAWRNLRVTSDNTSRGGRSGAGFRSVVAAGRRRRLNTQCARCCKLAQGHGPASRQRHLPGSACLDPPALRRQRQQRRQALALDRGVLQTTCRRAVQAWPGPPRLISYKHRSRKGGGTCSKPNARLYERAPQASARRARSGPCSVKWQGHRPVRPDGHDTALTPSGFGTCQFLALADASACAGPRPDLFSLLSIRS